MIERLRSLRHGFWFAVSRRIRWSRGLFVEKAAGALHLDPEDAERVLELCSRYGVRFEQTLGQRSATINYEYLDILDRAWESFGRDPPCGGAVCDVGCASFWYAAALHAFFRPQRLTGVEIEGHRLFRDGRARIDYASGYVASLPNAEFIVADYANFNEPADTITAWFPFVTSSAILAWRLPVSLLKPNVIFARIKHNLRSNGFFLMVNHGVREAEIAAACCIAAGLVAQGRCVHSGALSRHRAVSPVISLWRHA